MKRRDFAINSVAAASLATLPLASLAQKRKDAVVLGMTLEPTGLDPTAGAASAIAEIVQYNVFETLTKSQLRRQRHAAAGRELGSLARPQDLHLQAAQGRQVPERRALQCQHGQVLV
jgi:ABC-type oligopeptide transport system substrate-binding subunit